MNTLIKFTILGLALFILGYWLAYQLYKKSGKRLKGSPLATKIKLWIPIYLVTILFAATNNWVRAILVVWVIFNCWHELFTNKYQTNRQLVNFYVLIVSLGIAGALLIANHNQDLFLSIWLMSVLSDVTAFFAGNFFGKHFLPSQLNDKKSYEGVAGQFVGAIVGYLLINFLVVAVPVYFIFTVGIGSALGDLLNSYFKRQAGVKEWSQRLPGHGGYLDRFSSLSFALILTLWFLVIV